MSTDPKRKMMDDRITNDASKDGKKPKIDQVLLHPLPPTPTKEWAEQDWEIDQLMDDPQQIMEFKKKNNIDASQQIDMIIPGSYVKWGDPIGGDCGMDTTNGPARCYPCRCYTQLFTNLHGTSSIRKEVWIDEAMNLVVAQKEFADDSDDRYKYEGIATAVAFYNAIKEMKRSDFEDVYDANFSDVPSYFWSNGLWHKDEIIIDCGAIIPCRHCNRNILALGLKYHEICSNNQEDVALIPFINYLRAMLPSYERMEEFDIDHYYFRHRIGSKGFEKNTAFLKDAIADDSLSNIDEIVQKRIEAKKNSS